MSPGKPQQLLGDQQLGSNSGNSEGPPSALHKTALARPNDVKSVACCLLISLLSILLFMQLNATEVK